MISFLFWEYSSFWNYGILCVAYAVQVGRLRWTCKAKLDTKLDTSLEIVHVTMKEKGESAADPRDTSGNYCV